MSKKLFAILTVVLLTAGLFAQAPEKMSYQAVIRNSSNALVTNSQVGIQISILQGSATGTAVYTETQTSSTNANGLASIEIGTGTIVNGDFSTIDWSAGPYFIKTETDPTGGTNYSIAGTTQLLSVPYALHAKTAESITTTIPEYTAGTGIDITGDVIKNTAPDQVISLTGTGATTVSGSYPDFTINSNDVVNDADSDPTNELELPLTAITGQVLTWNGTDWVAQNSASGADNWGSQVVQTTGSNIAGDGTSGSPLNVTVTGLEKITEIGHPGWRLTGQDTANYGNIGIDAMDLSVSNFASSTKGATGQNSTAIGTSTTASGYSSTAMGDYSVASGGAATSMGDHTEASGSRSTAMGIYTIASGSYSTAMGDNTGAQAYASTAIGVYNIGGGNPTSFVSTDPLFEIGNGTVSTPGNALTVYKNGNTDITGVIRSRGNTWPTAGAGVEIAYDNTLGKGYIQSYDRNTATWKNLAIGAFDVFPVQDNYSNLGIPGNRWAAVYAVNGTIQTSDRRLKKDINDIPYGLNSILKLHPVSFKWKKGNQNVNLGLIAQDVQKVIPEVVDIGDDKDKTLGLNYSELIPVLISAIKEQQKEIEELEKKVEQMTSTN